MFSETNTVTALENADDKILVINDEIDKGTRNETIRSAARYLLIMAH
jgi:hypothetical protein